MPNKSKKPAVKAGLRLGLDENGLGPRLGPLVVTCAEGELSEAGALNWNRKLPAAIASDLDDSKALVSCHDYSLAEAWARVIFVRQNGHEPSSPKTLLEYLCPESQMELRRACPKSTIAQRWSAEREEFCSTDDQRQRLARHLSTLEQRGLKLGRVRSQVICTGKLNGLKQAGVHRFAADLHAMERLILAAQQERKQTLTAVCGKVGGIGKYEAFFGPLSGYLRTVLEEGQARSSYYFPGIGELHFVRDADAADPLVMLASLVGKYVRELLMRRIALFYRDHVHEEVSQPSGYHDPITSQFVEQTQKRRNQLKIVQDCFERRAATV